MTTMSCRSTPARARPTRSSKIFARASRTVAWLRRWPRRIFFTIRFSRTAHLPAMTRGCARMYFAVTGSYLAFIPTLDHPEMCGVNPEVAHEHMAGLNFVHHVAQAIEMGKLFHIDLNDQEFGRYDQDFRFGSANLKHAFFLVKLLEDSGYAGCRQFDAHAYRQADYDDVKEFAR